MRACPNLNTAMDNGQNLDGYFGKAQVTKPPLQLPLHPPPPIFHFVCHSLWATLLCPFVSFMSIWVFDDWWETILHLLDFFGREICVSQNPHCLHHLHHPHCLCHLCHLCHHTFELCWKHSSGSHICTGGGGDVLMLAVSGVRIPEVAWVSVLQISCKVAKGFEE